MVGYSYEQATTIINEMENRYESGFSFPDRDNISRLYYQVTGKRIANVSCPNCYRDAFIIIKLYLRNHTTMPEYEYILQAGIVIHTFGSDNYYALGVPSDVAEDWLSQDTTRIRFFDKFPTDWETRIAPAEIAPNAINDTSATTAKATTKKRTRTKKTSK